MATVCAFHVKSVGLSVEEDSKEQSNMSKRTSILALSLMANLIAFARDYSGHRYYDDPDISLPSGSEVGTGLIIAIIAIRNHAHKHKKNEYRKRHPNHNNPINYV